jgi:hypothetical protein
MLKKCVVIMVLFALVTGSAFAQMTLGGQLQEGITLLSGTNVNDDDVMMGAGYKSDDGPYHEAKLSVLFGDGTAGGRLVMNAKGSFWGWMQWRPNQFFRVKIGTDGDGEGGFPQIVGWGFTGEAKNSVAAVNDWGGGGNAMSFRNAGINYGAFDGASSFNLGLFLYPTDLINVTFLVRGITDNTDNTGGEISSKLAKAEIFSSFKLEEIGTIRFAAVGDGGFAKDADDGTKLAHFFLAFYSNEIVQGLAFEVGGRYGLPYLNTDQQEAISVALGVNLTSTDPFNFKLRTNINFGEKGKDGKDTETVQWGIGILPSYKLPKMTIFFHAGVGLEVKKDADEPTYDWFINPYIWVPMGGMRMWVGVQILDQHVVQDGQFKWNIPFGFNFYF